MFCISMPADFKVGDTRECHINMEPAQVTWLSDNVLMIEPDDGRVILSTERQGNLRVFFCGDKAAGADDYNVEKNRHGVFVSSKPPKE